MKILFVSLMCCCIHQESLVLIHPQSIEHHSKPGSVGVFIGLSFNTSQNQPVRWGWFIHQ